MTDVTCHRCSLTVPEDRAVCSREPGWFSWIYLHGVGAAVSAAIAWGMVRYLIGGWASGAVAWWEPLWLLIVPFPLILTNWQYREERRWAGRWTCFRCAVEENEPTL